MAGNGDLRVIFTENLWRMVASFILRALLLSNGDVVLEGHGTADDGQLWGVTGLRAVAGCPFYGEAALDGRVSVLWWGCTQWQDFHFLW